MQLHNIHIQDLIIPDTRQRREFKPEELVKLANSISQNGLIQPIVVRKDSEGSWVLVAGERRIRAMVYVWNFGEKVRCGEEQFPEGEIPCIYQGELSPADAFEMELEENIRRTDLTWQERATATARLMELRKQQAVNRGEPEPTMGGIAEEVRGTSGSSEMITRREVLVAPYLNDPEVAKAKNIEDAFKIIKRKEATQRNIDYAETLGRTFSAKVHRLYQGDCLQLLQDIPQETFDVVLTDPPYGIDAHLYGDSGGMTPGAHQYDDTLETWLYLMQGFARESFRVAKPSAHLYCFCDVDNFVTLKRLLGDAGWQVFRTPFVWHNPTAMRLPWLGCGPQRKYQILAYAVKGRRQVLGIFPDLVTYPSDENLGHQAQKPVELYLDLLKRSALAGNCVLDPFCGSGPIFPAAHALKCQAVGMELSPASYSIAARRIEALE